MEEKAKAFLVEYQELVAKHGVQFVAIIQSRMLGEVLQVEAQLVIAEGKGHESQ